MMGKPNRLQHENSPYLLQHAYNPVDWYPWGDEAFQMAKLLDKPVFLSIGYSSCHWCHVMEEESFADEEVAGLLNDAFVCVKVDREERPDIDGIYMNICQALTGSGGWPLTILLTPERWPFFAATYLPKEDRYGRKGLKTLVPFFKGLWLTKRQEIERRAAQIIEVMRTALVYEPGEILDKEAIQAAFAQLSAIFDERHGGFGGAPKFPSPHQLSFLLRYYHRTREKKALSMVEKTLQSMRRGGVYDQIGFGFHRYATDRAWILPHFEKMLSDQALTSLAYLDAWLLTGEGLYGRTAAEIFTYIKRDMTSPEGGFYTGEDADSEGREGKFYLWREEELSEALGAGAPLAAKLFNVEKEGNFYDEATGRRTGENVLFLSQEDLPPDLTQMTEKLRLFREKRVRPRLDDKILTDGNGLMIAALAKGGKALDNEGFLDMAGRAAGFILKHLRDDRGRLLHSYRQGIAAIPGFLDDYAYFIWGLWELYQSTYEEKYLKTALDLNGILLEDFWDEERGGFFQTPSGQRDIPLRRKEIYDGAHPSGNSVALLNLLQLGRVTGRTDWEDRASTMMKIFAKNAREAPAGHTWLLAAVDFAAGPVHQVIIAGQRGEKSTERMLDALRQIFLPRVVVSLRADDPNYPMIHDQATAYICRDFTCGPPLLSPDELIKTWASGQP